MKSAILQGHVAIGMTPDEVIAAAGAGQWSWLVIKSDPSWPENAYPLDMIYQQSSKPDKSIFRLDFANKTQFHSIEPVAFSVCFRNRRSFKVSQAEADMCDSGVTIN